LFFINQTGLVQENTADQTNLIKFSAFPLRPSASSALKIQIVNRKWSKPMTDTYTNSLITPDLADNLYRVRLANGRLIECPTVAEILRRHNQMKTWYAPRDLLINDFTSMAMLESPFAHDQAGLESAGYLLPSGESIFSVDSFPFEALTLAIS